MLVVVDVVFVEVDVFVLVVVVVVSSKVACRNLILAGTREMDRLALGLGR
jgi:hypothetical protein